MQHVVTRYAIVYKTYENVHEKIQGVFMENDSYTVSGALNNPLQTFIP